MIWYWINAATILFFVWRTSRRYGSLLNPVAFFGGYYMMATVVAPLIYNATGLFSNLSNAAVSYAVVLSAVYFAALGSAFLVKASPAEKFFAWLLDRIAVVQITERNSPMAASIFSLQFVALFALLMVSSDAGFMWLTNSREAYQFHRASVGVYWSLCQATLLLAYACVLFARARTMVSLLLVTLPFAVAALFLGSKSQTLAYLVLAFFYADLKIRRVPTVAIFVGGACVLCGGLALQFQQGTAADLINTLLYFDYFRNSAAFLDRFGEFGFRHGGAMFSNLWYYVPRALYAGKPYTYGQTMATELLFPGAAESFGATPGLIQWTVGYMDFGVVGVMISGLFSGFVAKGAFDLLRARKNIVSFALFAQIGLIYYVEMFPNAPFPVFFLWLAVQGALVWFARALITPYARTASADAPSAS